MTNYCLIEQQLETFSTNNYFKIIIKIIIILILAFLLLFYLFTEQDINKNIKYISKSSSLILPKNIPKININNLKINKDVYTQMTLIQKLYYLQSLFKYNSIDNCEQKQIIDKQITSHLSKEYQYNKKQNNNYQQLSLLSEKIKFKLDLLQNPNNCFNAKIMVCPIDPPGWGFGHLLHLTRFCFILAIESGRTMILNNENTKIFKFDVRWNEIFKSNSKCNYEEHVKPFLPIKDFLEKEQSDRITIFRHKYEMYSRGFDVAPLEIKEFILKYHSNPILWFRSQLLNYIWRENEKTLNLTNKIVSKIPFECGPIVGIHVRRTDKITEAKLHELDEYMKWVDFWYDVMGEKHKTIKYNHCPNKRMLYIATDDTDVFKEAYNKYGDRYEIYHQKTFKNEKQYKSKEALTELLALYRILAKCSFLVCTLSSNTCEIIYEIMQILQGDAIENVHSLDYFYGQCWMENEMESISDYKPIQDYPHTPEELWSEKGDVILLLGPHHQNGIIRAKNLNSNKEGNFHFYLIKKHTKFEKISLFDKIN